MLNHSLLIVLITVFCAINPFHKVSAVEPAAQGPTPAAAASLKLIDKLLWEVDLSTGNAPGGKIAGGEWIKGQGWRTTGAKAERIVFDAGKPITNGYLEIQFTADELPWFSAQGKINYAGLHEDESLDQNRHGGDIFYIRTGSEKYKFSKAKASGKKFDKTEWEPALGSVNDWKPDGKTLHTVRLEWTNGVATFVDPTGARHPMPSAIAKDHPLDRLRYAFVGSDAYNGLTVKGLCFTSIKLVEQLKADRAAKE